MFKIIVLIAVVYLVYRYQDIKKLTDPLEEDPGEEFIDYEEID